MKIYRALALASLTAFTIVAFGEIGSPLTAADPKAEKKAARLKLKEEAKKKADDDAKAEEAKKIEDAKRAEEASKAADAKKVADAKKPAPVATVPVPHGKQDAGAAAKMIDRSIDARLLKEGLLCSDIEWRDL